MLLSTSHIEICSILCIRFVLCIFVDSFFIVTPIVCGGFFVWSMFGYAVLSVLISFEIIWKGIKIYFNCIPDVL